MLVFDRRRIVNMNSLEPSQIVCRSHGSAPIEWAGIAARATGWRRLRPLVTRHRINAETVAALAAPGAVVARHHRVGGPARAALAIDTIPHAFIIGGLRRGLAPLEPRGCRSARGTHSRRTPGLTRATLPTRSRSRGSRLRSTAHGSASDAERAGVESRGTRITPGSPARIVRAVGAGHSWSTVLTNRAFDRRTATRKSDTDAEAEDKEPNARFAGEGTHRNENPSDGSDPGSGTHFGFRAELKMSDYGHFAYISRVAARSALAPTFL